MARGIALVLVLTGLVVVVAVAAGLWRLRSQEYDFVFTTASSHSNLVDQLPADAERVTLTADKGVAVAGVIFHADPGNANGFWLLHLHGSADSAFSTGQVRHSEALRTVGFNVLAFDYRGFGMTPGTASEAAMYEDSETAYQGLIRLGVPDNRIIVLGHSLGTTPAVVLAARHSPAALVLFGAFTSAPDVIAGLHPYLPVRLVLQVQLNSLQRIGGVHVPLIIAHSSSDDIVPYAHALRLFAAANEPKRFIRLAPSNSDGLGGHSSALYENLSQLDAKLLELVPSFPAARTP